ncbi:GNAT family N-acetyltransferase [Streptomyces triticagri]|uniref:GNAT family N-acetyltransferase n=1 Tax=Streptomyces triticagri TaxID=2293568 RepID=A0A372M8K8_9ACTN|nr:GNAT family N-acetyltransferase [Streptomyces triticagri]RFU87282.1 GNAT family N-acetyltransferase [Streptomyces triticagri]
MTVTVREFRAADAEATAEVLRAAIPFLVITPEAMIWAMDHVAPAARQLMLVGELDGRIVARGEIDLAYDSPEPGQANANIYVHPEERGRGVGTRILRAAEEYLAAQGATAVYSWVLDEPANRTFAAAHGYRPSRSAHFLRLDLTQGLSQGPAQGGLPPLAPVPPGVQVRSAADFADDPRPLFDLDAETTADEPGDVAARLDDYEDWLRTTWAHPCLDRELTTVAVVDGVPVAFTAARTDGRTRYMSGMTGTARAHRGRGLARLVKSHSLHRAAAAGCTEAFTGNDTENAPMLAVNKSFGYEICATEIRHVRELG